MPPRIKRAGPPSCPEERSRLPSALTADPPAQPTSDDDPAQSPFEPAPPFLSLREAADWLGVSISTLKRLVAKRALRTLRIGARRNIPGSELNAYVTQDVLFPDQIKDPDDD
jgi:excisionase family DNA binding protein